MWKTEKKVKAIKEEWWWWWFSCWAVSDSGDPMNCSPTRLLCAWDFPGKNAGVGCHFSERRIQFLKSRYLEFLTSNVVIWGYFVMLCVCLVAQSCLPRCNPVDCSPPGSSVPGILQARILEWVAMPFSRGSCQPRNQTQVSCICDVRRGFFENPFLFKKNHALLESRTDIQTKRKCVSSDLRKLLDLSWETEWKAQTWKYYEEILIYIV